MLTHIQEKKRWGSVYSIFGVCFQSDKFTHGYFSRHGTHRQRKNKDVFQKITEV